MSAVLAHPAHAVVTDGLTVERFLEIAAEALAALHVVVADDRGEPLAWAPVAARADAAASAKAALDDVRDARLYVARLTDVPARFLALRWSDPGERALDEAHGVAATVAAMLARGMDTELDALTGLPNRSATLQSLRERIADRRTAMAGVAFIDLDGFKLVNDRFGHAAGDRALSEAGRRLRASARAGDVVGRHGGDEFVAAVSGAGPDEIFETVERFRRALRFDVEHDGARVALSASIGVAMFPGDGRSAEELIERADAAMYVAKRNGGDVVRRVDDVEPVVAAAPVTTPADVPAAAPAPALSVVESVALDFVRDVVVCFQPIVDVANGPTLRGWEALLRWRHPERGWLRPPLPHGVLRDADDWLAVHVQTLLSGRIPSAPIHLNVPAFDDVAVARVERLFAARPELRGWIALELPAAVAHADLDAAARVAARLRELGAGVGLEGVTLASSTLGVLVGLHLDFVKLDVAQVDDPAVLARTIQLVRATGAAPYVQGVASAEAAGVLASAGAAGLQGYGIASPMLAADATTWIASHRWLQSVLRVTPEAVRVVSAVR